MKKGKTALLLVLDRSGSMDRTHSDLVSGVNRFIEDQKQLPGEGIIHIVSFDTEIKDELWGTNLQLTQTFNTKEHFVPRGSTALYDAIGHGVDKLGKDLAALPEEERPEEIIVVIYTDGLENSSTKFNQLTIKEKIEHQQSKYNWRFIFLGANQDAILTAQTIGIASDSALTYNNTSLGNFGAFSGMSMLASGYRTEHTGRFTQKVRVAAMAN
jgi:uncharacterized protein YegL